MPLGARFPFLVLSAALAAGCAGSGQLGLTSDDNDPEKLAAALARAQEPKSGQPKNSLGKPLAFLAARGDQRELVAYDLAGKKVLWRVPSEVESKVVVGSDFVAHVEGDRHLVGRDVATGKKLWQHDLEGREFLGGAAGSQRVFFTVKDTSDDKPKWVLTALEGRSGDEAWIVESPGLLGAPKARGGLVFSPFLKQWLTILDAETGEQLTRIRGLEEEISFVRATSTDVYFGSKQGVFLLDERAASGKPSQSTYGAAKLPEEFVRVHYYWDAFDKIQAGYSAYDRNRILWRGQPKGEELGFQDERVIVHTFRFFFGFDAKTGELQWAYNHPRLDVVASAHTGSVIGFASILGDLGALDPATGERVYRAKVKGVKGLLGATFDAEGWSPRDAGAAKGEASGTAAALLSIARDRDARFNEVKRFAVSQLASLKGPEVTRDLLALVQSENTPKFLLETATRVLVTRGDPSGLPHLVKALGARYDYIEGKKPKAIGAVARALAALGDAKLPRKGRAAAIGGLLAHLEAPETPAADLEPIIRALGAIGRGDQIPALRSFVLTYRADPAFSARIAPMSAAVDVLLDTGGPAEHELVSFVAEDARTQSEVAEYARRALARAESKKGEGESAEGSGAESESKPKAASGR